MFERGLERQSIARFGEYCSDYVHIYPYPANQRYTEHGVIRVFNYMQSYAYLSDRAVSATPQPGLLTMGFVTQQCILKRGKGAAIPPLAVIDAAGARQ